MRLAASALCGAWLDVTLTDAEISVLGVPDGPFLRQTDPAALAAFNAQLARLAAAGYTIWHVPTLLDIADLNQMHRRLVFAEFAREHAQMYAQFKSLYRPRTAEIIEQGRRVSDGELAELRQATFVLRDSLEKQMDQAGIDLWICPSAPGPAPAGLHATGDPNLNLPWTNAGMPAVTLPAGQAAGGLPLGVQLVGPTEEDEMLLAWAELVAADL